MKTWKQVESRIERNRLPYRVESDALVTLGGRASDYTALFTEHPVCAIQKRSADTLALMRSIREAAEHSMVYISTGGR